MPVEITAVRVDVPAGANVIVGQAHFVKTVEDLHEILAGSSPHLRFGVAFSEASGDRLVRTSGNDADLESAARAAALAIASGHVFVILLREGFPINVLNAVKQCPEVAHVFCATANPLEILVATTPNGRGVVGVVDGAPPLGAETEPDVAKRKALLRKFGYKLG
jgi:adenosine/AMP kinase